MVRWTLTPRVPGPRRASGRGLAATRSPKTVLGDPGVAGDVTPASPRVCRSPLGCGLPESCQTQTGSKGEGELCSRRHQEKPLRTHRSSCPWRSLCRLVDSGLFRNPHPSPGPRRAAEGWARAGASRRLVAVPAPAPGAAQPRGSCSLARGLRGRGLRGSAAEPVAAAVAGRVPGAPTRVRAPARSGGALRLLLPATCFPAAPSPRAPPTSASGAGGSSRLPAPSLLCCAMRVGFPI